MSSSNHSPHGTLIYAEEEVERSQEPEVIDDFKDTVSSGHNRTNAHLNSEAVAAHTEPTQVQAQPGCST